MSEKTKVSALLEKIKNDDRLDLFIRTDGRVDCYCSGGLFLKIKANNSIELMSKEYVKYLACEDPTGEKQNCLNKMFAQKSERQVKAIDVLLSEEAVFQNATYWDLMLRAIELRANSNKTYRERKQQQVIARNNRTGYDTCISDMFFRVDMNGTRALCDMIAVSEERKRILFIEYKTGKFSYTGKSSVLSHYNDIKKYKDDIAIKKEVLARFAAMKVLWSTYDLAAARKALCAEISDECAEEYYTYCVIMITGADSAKKFDNCVNTMNDRCPHDVEIGYVYNDDYEKATDLLNVMRIYTLLKLW